MHQTIKKCYISVNVQKVDFDINSEIKKIKSNKIIGGIVNFTGIVRNSGGEKEELVSLELEHYPGMTESEIEKIIVESYKKWELTGISVIHRIGNLKPSDQIVFVGVSSKHRQNAFDGCNFIMDWLKTKAPFWKIEESNNKKHWVKFNDTDNQALQKWEK